MQSSGVAWVASRAVAIVAEKRHERAAAAAAVHEAAHEEAVHEEAFVIRDQSGLGRRRRSGTVCICTRVCVFLIYLIHSKLDLTWYLA